MNEFSSTEFDVECLFCGTIQQMHTNVDGETPRPGDIVICFDCGYVAEYGEDMQLVALSSERQQLVESNEKFQAMMFALRVMKDREADETN